MSWVGGIDVICWEEKNESCKVMGIIWFYFYNFKRKGGKFYVCVYVWMSLENDIEWFIVLKG